MRENEIDDYIEELKMIEEIDLLKTMTQRHQLIHQHVGELYKTKNLPPHLHPSQKFRPEFMKLFTIDN